jgi:hypothetical protein
MLPKCVETIDRLPHEGKDIVRSSGKLETRVHHRHGYRLGNPPEPAEGHRGRSHHNRCGHVRRSQELTPVTPGEATVAQGRGSRINSLGASFPIWSAIGL